MSWWQVNRWRKSIELCRRRRRKKIAKETHESVVVLSILFLSCGNWNLDRPLFGLLSPFIVRHQEDRALAGLLSHPSLDGRLGRGKVMYETSFILEFCAACTLAFLPFVITLWLCWVCMNNCITVGWIWNDDRVVCASEHGGQTCLCCVRVRVCVVLVVVSRQQPASLRIVWTQ